VSVENPNVIDAVGTDRVTGDVVLTITDHLEWDDGDEHVLVLQAKINRYLDFIQSGELLEQYPKAQGKRVRMELICRFSPSARGTRFLTRAQEVIEGGGWTFSWRVFGGS
jgi:hypothetical protein